MKKLFVGGIPFSFSNDDLRNLFSEFGTVETADIIMDRETNRSKGFGFVEFSTEEEAQKAIQALDGKEVDGRRIGVSIARPKEERPRRDFDGQRGGFNQNRDNNSRGGYNRNNNRDRRR